VNLDAWYRGNILETTDIRYGPIQFSPISRYPLENPTVLQSLIEMICGHFKKTSHELGKINSPLKYASGYDWMITVKNNVPYILQRRY